MIRPCTSSLLFVLCLGLHSPAMAQPTASRWLERAQRAATVHQAGRAATLLRRGLRRFPSDPALALALARLTTPRDASAAARADETGLRERVDAARATLRVVALPEPDTDEDERQNTRYRRELWLEGAWLRALGGDLHEAILAIAGRNPRVDRDAALRLREIAALAVRRSRLAEASLALAQARAADATLGGLAEDESALLAARGRLGDSVTRLRQGLVAQPEDDRASLALARVLLAEGEVDEALDLYHARAARCPRLGSCDAEWARAALQARRFALARRIALSLTQPPTRGSQPFTLLGLAELGLRHPERAAEAFRRALALDPEDARARASLRALTRVLAPSPAPPSVESAEGDSAAMMGP